eukprot:TRINITY_DN4511_c0_g3_i1.p1 TRINITY_DN4511_c0_g3~~TRINITY_DN4511_c0_g3_i1.p1  ORF type:complete len:689 (-),score=156.28 TRINITY_DN4511_c0_g3_i1:250-2316(-)
MAAAGYATSLPLSQDASPDSSLNGVSPTSLTGTTVTASTSCSSPSSRIARAKLSKMGTKLLDLAHKDMDLKAHQWDDFHPKEPMVVTRHDFCPATEAWKTEKVLVEIAEKPFGNGALRECFKMREVHIPLTESGEMDLATAKTQLHDTVHRRLRVAKRSIKEHTELEKHKQDCMQDTLLQMHAKHYAEVFNKQEIACGAVRSASKGGVSAHHIDFLMSYIIELDDGSTYSVELFIPGKYEKHNNNSGHTFGMHRTPQAFSYFTFCYSKGQAMCVDLQGVDNVYTDPVLHYLPSSRPSWGDTNVNLGIKGFALFLWSHRFNAIDRQLELPKFALALSEQVHLGVAGKDLIEKARTEVAVSAKDRRQADKDNNKNVDTVMLCEVPGVNTDPKAWAAERLPPVPEAIFPLSFEGVIAECHLQIADLYETGALSDTAGKALDRDELEAAVFHVAEAAKRGRTEALLLLARMASDLQHEEFLAGVLPPVEDDNALCITLLERAAERGCCVAHACAARLLQAKEMDKATARRVAKHLEQFADKAYAAAAAGPPEPKLKGVEVSTVYNFTFGWEDMHNLEAHSAYAECAELWQDRLRSDRCGEMSGREKAIELWQSASEVALEDPRLGKKAMQYTEKATLLEDEEDAEATPMNSPFVGFAGLAISNEMVKKFKKFAAGHSSHDAAMEALLKLAGV